MRIDVPPPGEEGQCVRTMPSRGLYDADAALLVAYVDEATGSAPVLDVTAAGLAVLGVSVVCAMTVSGGRYLLSACVNPDLPRDRWVDLTPDHPAALELALHRGAAPLPSRAALAALLDLDPRWAGVRDQFDQIDEATGW